MNAHPIPPPKIPKKKRILNLSRFPNPNRSKKKTKDNGILLKYPEINQTLLF
jgi:hypothetical protein